MVKPPPPQKRPRGLGLKSTSLSPGTYLRHSPHRTISVRAFGEWFSGTGVGNVIPKWLEVILSRFLISAMEFLRASGFGVLGLGV